MSSYIKSLKLPIAIIGLGKSGEAALELLLLSGIKRSEIITFDANQAADCNQPEALLAKAPQTLVVSPGVPLKLPFIEKLRTSGIKITSELTLACSLLHSEKVIGITGSLGKSTTTAALGHALGAWDPHAFAGGNLGTPLAEYVCQVISGKRPRAQWIALEISSYQLENCDLLSLHAGVITYLSPNHLERYSSLEDYYHTKWILFDRCQGPVFCNQNGGDLLSWSQKHPRKTALWVHPKSELKSAALIGSHNQQNLALAQEVLTFIKAPPACTENLLKFSGLPHRMENLGHRNGVLYVNDSKATALDSVETAANSCLESLGKGSLYLLLGGKDKNLPWAQLKSIKDSRVQFVLFGQCRRTIAEALETSSPQFASLKEALVYARDHAKNGDTVLLSPGGTSLDEFKNFEERGNFLKAFLGST